LYLSKMSLRYHIPTGALLKGTPKTRPFLYELIYSLYLGNSPLCLLM
jgi:hypothetical protein